jgi:hypothetical protein
MPTGRPYYDRAFAALEAEGTMYDTEAEARKDWQSIAPQYRTRERLDEMLAQVRQTATTLECKVCGNTDPDKFSVITSGFRATRWPGHRAEELGGMVLDGARCLVCKDRDGRRYEQSRKQESPRKFRRERPRYPTPHVHEWSDWKEIGRTGDWFHPLIVERKCKGCGKRETDEH